MRHLALVARSLYFSMGKQLCWAGSIRWCKLTVQYTMECLWESWLTHDLHAGEWPDPQGKLYSFHASYASQTSVQLLFSFPKPRRIPTTCQSLFKLASVMLHAHGGEKCVELLTDGMLPSWLLMAYCTVCYRTLRGFIPHVCSAWGSLLWIVKKYRCPFPIVCLSGRGIFPPPIPFCHATCTHQPSCHLVYDSQRLDNFWSHVTVYNRCKNSCLLCL